MASAPTSSTAAPVRFIPTDVTTAPKPGIGLCLSGGGYRAMVFHLGSLWRLNEAGLLPKLKRVSSVSGGSLTAGVLGMNWSQLNFDGSGIAGQFQLVVDAIRAVAGRTIDVGSVLGGIFLPGTAGDKLAAAYEKHLFKGATLQNLPDDASGPRFVINSTNVQTGSLWRFSRPYMGDWQVGLIRNPQTPLAQAVAASSAFPPVLSPVNLDVDPADFDPTTYGPLFQPPFNDEVVLSDGGVYDNLGLETVWKELQTVLVSNGGLKAAPDPHPKTDWARHAMRVINLIQNQVWALRIRQLIESYNLPNTDPHFRTGTYWGIAATFNEYQAGSTLSDPLGLAGFDPTPLATVETRLEAMPALLQEKLINWGYATSDTAIRRHLSPTPANPAGLPYPGSGL